jgi:hypothetical protein
MMTIRRPQAASGQEAEAHKKSQASTEAVPDTEAMLKAATGCSDESLGIALLVQATSSFTALTHAQHQEALQNGVAALIGVAPRDGVEGMLATQMIAAHSAAMDCQRRAHAEGLSIEAREQNLKYAAKFMTVFARQVEALAKHRGKGQPELTVGNVNVNAGGQAIVGHLAGAASGTSAARAQSADPPTSSPPTLEPAPPAAEKRVAVVKLITRPTR